MDPPDWGDAMIYPHNLTGVSNPYPKLRDNERACRECEDWLMGKDAETWAEFQRECARGEE